MSHRAMRFVVLAFLSAAGVARANNLTLTNVTVRPRDDSTAFVRFDIRWENSWRHTNINHDAAWVFFKIKPEGRTDWEHVVLETNDYSTGTGTAVEVVAPSDRAGCFIRRAGEGSGTLSVTNVKVAWNFASNSLVKTDRVKLQAFAVEMVYVAEGAFYLGSGGTEPGSFTDGSWVGPTNNATIPFRVTNEAALTITNTAGNLWGTSTSGNSTIGPAGVLPADFPKGYAAFYCMKYEVTQGQYRDFLKSLTRLQQNTRTASQSANYYAMSGSVRNGIRCPAVVPVTPGVIVFGCDGNDNKIMNETNDAMDRACNCLSWADGCALADWAGLRPMTELEFEKACRGPLDPVTNEYIWGATFITQQTGHSGADGSGSERATPANANCYYGNVMLGPVRAGIFATTNSTRQAAGASYWGILDLGGNVFERAVSAADATGRLFTGLHGNGRLTGQGNADVAGWPGAAGAGSGIRGGGYLTDSSMLRVSDRSYFAFSAAYGRGDGFGGNSVGWRGARTAPAGVGP